MAKRNTGILSLFLLLLLAACAPARAPLSTEISAVMQDDQILPAEWRIPAGQKITLTLDNQGKVEHHWVLMARPVTAPFDRQDETQVLFRAPVQAGQTATVQFTAPAAAGEYQVICDEPGHMEAGMVARVIVVQEQ